MTWGAIVALRLLIFSQVLLAALVFAARPNPWRLRLAGTLLMCGMLGYFVAPLLYQYTSAWAGWTAGAVAGGVPAFLLWLVWIVFEDDRPLPALGRLVLALYLLGLLAIEVADIDVWRLGFQLFKLAMAASVMLILWRGRAADLVEDRVRLRRWLAIAIGAVVVSVVLVELTSGLQVPTHIEMFGMGMIFLLALGFNWLMFQQAASAAFSRVVAVADAPVDIAVAEQDHTNPLLRQLIERMTQERLYADHDLRVGQLAALLNVQEYRLRQAINQDLGFRNFNQFVNQYRIDEASKRLQQTPDVPVLTIALDVGFRSISSFNAAFKARFGMAPTQYRSRHLPES